MKELGIEVVKCLKALLANVYKELCKWITKA
jgi:hypothetical protein